MSSHEENTPKPKLPIRRRLFSDEDDPIDTSPSISPVPINNPDKNSFTDQVGNASNDLHASMEEYMRSERQRAQERWNFNFEEEKPLEGVWEWEKVEPEHEIARDQIARFEVGIGTVQSNDENHSL